MVKDWFGKLGIFGIMDGLGKSVKFGVSVVRENMENFVFLV